MKFATAWWGIQILAESDEDKDILQSLFDRLPEEADVSYENGFVCIASPEYAENGGFRSGRKVLMNDEEESLFLSELVKHAKKYGWEGRGDYEEVWKFVEWCHKVANKPVNEDIDPYEDEDDPVGLK